MTRTLVLTFFGLLSVVLQALAFQERPPLVDPADLTRRPELLGKPLTIDDRVEGIPSFTRDVGFNLLKLQRAPGVVFRLPERLSFEKPSRVPAVRLEGTLRREGGRFVFDVSALQVYPEDLERLEQAVAPLAPRDAEGRRVWARWAEQRADAFDDPELASKARQLEAEALKIDAERPGRRTPGEWLELAETARQRQTPGPVPKALAHRGFRPLLSEARTLNELEPLVKRIEAFFPDALKPVPGNANPWQRRYEADPYAAYLDAEKTNPQSAAAIDRALVADAVQRLLELQAEAAPDQSFPLADAAQNRLPDRPGVARHLEDRGIEAFRADLTSKSRAEVEAIAGRLERRGDPEAALALRQQRLQALRDRLGHQDAEGRVDLADQYRQAGDPTAASDLLLEAIRIDPGFNRAAEALRRLGFRKVGDDWIAGNPQSTTTTTPTQNRPAAQLPDALEGLTREQVRDRMGGNPERVIRSASQGQFLEQWIYRTPRGLQYINFLQITGRSQARVIGQYSLP